MSLAEQDDLSTWGRLGRDDKDKSSACSIRPRVRIA